MCSFRLWYTNKESFEELKQYWLPTVKEQIDSNLIYLLGNKCDLYDRETVTEKEAKLFAIDNNLRFLQFEPEINLKMYFVWKKNHIHTKASEIFLEELQKIIQDVRN